MTPLISTGRERRVRQTEPCCRNSDGEPLYRGHPGHSLNQRTGTDRRVASYRNWISGRTGRDTFKRDLILALRRPRGVVVVEGEYINGRVYPDNDAASYTAFGKRVKGLTDGHRVRVVVEKCDE